jgi:hypothetical protein
MEKLFQNAVDHLTCEETLISLSNGMYRPRLASGKMDDLKEVSAFGSANSHLEIAFFVELTVQSSEQPISHAPHFAIRNTAFD